MKKYELKNVSEPELFEDIYDYDKVPAIQFSDEPIAMNLPDDIWITDTTFRDGQQARAPYDVDTMVELFKLISKLGGPNGVIRMSEFFMYSDKDKKAIEKIKELGIEYPIVTSWIRASKADFELVKQFEIKETGILTSVSDYHIFFKMKSDRQKIMDKYLEIVDIALENEIVPRCHFEDITRADFEGFVIPLAQKLMERSQQAGMPVKIRACDTLGFGLPFPNSRIPRSVPHIFDMLINEAGVPSEYLEWHGHNDFHKGLVNATTAWMYGCAAVNGTVLGFGERTGNTPIEAAIIDYISIKGDFNGVDTLAINEIARYYHDNIGEIIPANFPFVGKDFNTTRAGIHADGAIKNERIYNIFNTEKILNRPLDVAITDKSGVAGVALWLNKHFNLEDAKKMTKDDAGVVGIYDWVMEQYQKDRITSISAAELIEQAKRHIPRLFQSDLTVLREKGKRLAIELIEEILAEPALKTMSAEKIDPVLKNYRHHDVFVKFFIVVDEKGQRVTDAIFQPEDSNKYAKIDKIESFANRQWFKEAKKGEIFVSYFYISKYTEQLCITISAPIKDDDGKVVGVLGMDMDFDDLMKIVSSN